MENFIIKYYKLVIVSLIIIGAFSLILIQNSRLKSDLADYKETILKKDSLEKIRDGEYTKLVNDLKTSNDLKKYIKEISENTYKDIKKNKEKPLIITKISTVPKNIQTIDTVYVDTLGVRTITSYYPDKDSMYIKHTSVIKDKESKNTWEFSPLKLNVIVTQQKDGMYRARFIGPSWIEAQEVTVNSLPLSSITERKFKILLGASGGYDFNYRNISAGIYTGFRYKNQIVLVNGNTNKVVSLGYIKEF